MKQTHSDETMTSQYAILGRQGRACPRSRRDHSDLIAEMLAMPKAIPRPSVAEIIAETNSAVAECVPIARRIFQLPAEWDIGPTSMSWEWWGSCCLFADGQHYLQFDFTHLICLEDEDFAVAREYGIYRNDRVIGQIATTDWRIHIQKTVAHELAHAIQLSLPLTNTPLHLGRQFYQGIGVFHDGHSAFFQEIYARLREELVNPLVPSSAIGLSGARTRVKSPPGLNEVSHPLIGVAINHPKHGRLEAVMVKKSAIYTTGGPRDALTPIPFGRFKKLHSG
jgi:hypothetical protein